MGSKGRIPPSHHHHHHHQHQHHRRGGPPDPYGPSHHHPSSRGGGGPYPPYDMLPPPQVLEQKLASQHVEMQRLATENQRLASTHGTLRQELAGAQHELQVLHAQAAGMKAEREQQMRAIADKIAKLELDLKSGEPVKKELQQARVEAQGLVVARQEGIAKAQQLSQELQRAHGEAQQLPVLVSQLEGLRQEYQHCRATFDYEKKLYNDHLESLQVMEKNYVTMAREVEKLRAELLNNSGVDRRTGAAPFYGNPGTNDNEAAGHAVGQNVYEEGYGVPQGRAPFPSTATTGGVGGPGGSVAAGAGASGAAAAATAGTSPFAGTQSGPPGRTGYEAQRGTVGYDPSGGSAYDAQRPGYDPQRGAVYDAQRPGYDPQRAAYDAQRPGYDVQRGPAYDPSRGLNYDAQSTGAPVSQGHVPTTNMPYGSATLPTARGGTGYEAQPPRGATNPTIRR